MAVSLSANVRNRRRRRDNHTDREGPQPPDLAVREVIMEVGLGPRVPTAKSERLVSVQSRDLRREPGQRARRAGTGRSPPEPMRHYLTVHLEYLNPEWLSVAAEGQVALNRREKGHTPEARRAIPESAPCSRLSLKPSAVLKASHESV